MVRWLLAVVLVGCGHIGFYPVAGRDGGPPDDMAVARWELVQTAGTRAATVAVKPLASHHLVVVAIQIDSGGQITGVTDTSNCNAYVAIPEAQATCTVLGDGLQLFYARDSCAGADGIRIAAAAAQESRA